VAWDGDCIHDRNYLNKANSTYDRTNPEESKLAFAKLFKETEFQSWQVTSVYRLCQYSSHTPHPTMSLAAPPAASYLKDPVPIACSLSCSLPLCLCLNTANRSKCTPGIHYIRRSRPSRCHGRRLLRA
jgi:hypothetical protein